MNRRDGRSWVVTIVVTIVVLALVAGSLAAAFSGVIIERSDEPSTVDTGAEISRLRTVVAENPSDTSAMAVLANIYANNGQVQESLPYYERAVNARPDDGSLRLAFGIALYRAGSFFDAEVQFRRAVELSPDQAAPAFYLGQVYESRPEPDLEEARRWYEEAISIAPDSLVAGQARERLAQLDADAGTPRTTTTP
jgi:Flp pilus assembly protein TadD